MAGLQRTVLEDRAPVFLKRYQLVALRSHLDFDADPELGPELAALLDAALNGPQPPNPDVAEGEVHKQEAGTQDD